MWRTPRWALVLVLALVALTAGAWAGPGPTPPGGVAQPRTRVELGQVVQAVTYIDTYVASARGLFAEQGLDVETTVYNDPGTAGRAFMGASNDVINSGLDYMIRAAEQTNNNVVAIAGQDRRSPFALIATPDITSYQDLRGQVVAVVGPNDGTTLLLKRMLAANGLRENDYEQRVVGGTPLRIAAMQAGAAKAAMITPPAFFTVQDQGMRVLGLAADYVPDYAFANHYVRRDWAERNRETVVRYLAAIVKANRWLADPANKEEGIRILAESTRTAPDLARRSWEYVFEQIDARARDGEVHVPGVVTIIEQLGEIGELSRPLPPPERYIDTRYLEEARQRVR